MPWRRVCECTPESEAWLIDRDEQRLVLKDGEALDYEVLILATGSAARIPPALIAVASEFPGPQQPR